MMKKSQDFLKEYKINKFINKWRKHTDSHDSDVGGFTFRNIQIK